MYKDWMKEMPIIVNGEGKRNEDTYKNFKKKQLIKRRISNVR